MGYLYNKQFDSRLAPWQPTMLGRIPPPDAPAVRPRMPDSAPAPQRAAESAYSLSGTGRGSPVPPPDTSTVEVASGKLLFPSVAPGPERAGNAAYNIAAPRFGSTAPPIDVSLITPAPGRVLFPDRAPAAERAAVTAYDVRPPRTNAPLPPPDEPTPGRPTFPERAPAAQRAANTAYLGGGGNVAFFAEGTPLPGCPYRPPRVGPGPSLPGRTPATADERPGRVAEATTQPARPPDPCCC